MRVTTVPFDLRQWRTAMGLTQARAADLLGMSLSGYRSAEYRATDHGECNKTLAGFANLMYSLRVAVEIPMAKDSP